MKREKCASDISREKFAEIEPPLRGVRRGAYSTPSRTAFHRDGGQHSTVMADTVPR
jgi:hypothetical protein